MIVPNKGETRPDIDNLKRMQNTFATSNSDESNKICVKMARTVIQHLHQVLGSSFTQAIELYLQKNMNTSLRRVYYEPEKIREGLISIFKMALPIIEIEILSALSQEFGVAHDSTQTDLVTGVTKLKEIIAIQ